MEPLTDPKTTSVCSHSSVPDWLFFFLVNKCFSHRERVWFILWNILEDSKAYSKSAQISQYIATLAESSPYNHTNQLWSMGDSWVGGEQLAFYLCRKGVEQIARQPSLNCSRICGSLLYCGWMLLRHPRLWPARWGLPDLGWTPISWRCGVCAVAAGDGVWFRLCSPCQAAPGPHSLGYSGSSACRPPTHHSFLEAEDIFEGIFASVHSTQCRVRGKSIWNDSNKQMSVW